jgi:hypothetical protein
MVIVAPSLVRVTVGAAGAEGRTEKSVRASDPESDVEPSGLPPLSDADADEVIVLDPLDKCATVRVPEPRVGVLFERKSYVQFPDHVAPLTFTAQSPAPPLNEAEFPTTRRTQDTADVFAAEFVDVSFTSR